MLDNPNTVNDKARFVSRGYTLQWSEPTAELTYLLLSTCTDLCATGTHKIALHVSIVIRRSLDIAVMFVQNNSRQPDERRFTLSALRGSWS